MLNIFSLLGPSRCGKGAIIPLIASVKNFELPFNTPDLDWYVDAYNYGDLTSDALCRLSANYLLCYSWYGHLGRHINLRPNDYYSQQKMMPHINLSAKHNKEDKDYEFENFANANDSKEIWNIFQWDLPTDIYEKFQKSFPINTNPLYCYRSPYYLFTSWISSNRVKRSNALSRMFKYDSTPKLKRIDLCQQFENARNDNEVSFIKKLGTYKYHEFKFDEVTIDLNEEARLLKLIKENKINASYWSKKDMLYRFEHIVTNPEKFIDYLINRLNIEFDEKLLKEGVVLMDKRPLDKVVEMDIEKAKETLASLGCNRNIIEYVIKEQIDYINDL